MDGNQPSSVSNAGATRKRRSSILKSQRPPRTPFSELEFNVATPTDATKSRRVSFSRKTGVAEFATNEATTTWKNFYEEQNKSLESSGNELERPPRPSVLGNRMFDQQFQEVEAEIDFGSFAPNPIPLSTSLNNVNITEQIAMLDSADDKLSAPSNKFELSAFTETNSKIMNDLTIHTIGADSGRIDVNFSNLNTIGSNHGNNDDLDEIERDLDMSRPKIVGPAFAGEISQYIEFDLNGTQGPLRGNDSDMSITDTIHSPKKEVSKSISITDRNNWVEDKENIVLNPYVSPAESDNFVVNDESSQVLVFDGKKLKYADINADLDEVVEDLAMSNKTNVQTKRQTIVYENQDAEISMTQCISNQFKSNNTIVFHEDNDADMSVTQAVPNHILKSGENNSNKKRQTIVFANDDINADISMTQAIPNKILSHNIKPQRKRQTIVYENDGADISMTQCIPNAMISSNATESEKAAEPPMQPKRQTIVFANDDAEISMTQAIPTNILNRKSLKPEYEYPKTTEDQTKRQTIVFDNDHIDADISMTQAIPTNILSRKSLKPENSESSYIQPKRQTMIFENDNSDADISMTQAIPTNILNKECLKPTETESREQSTANNDNFEISMTQAIPTNILSSITGIQSKRQTIVFANDDVNGDISMTQAIPTNIVNSVTFKEENCVTEKQQKWQTTKSNIMDRKSLSPEIAEPVETEKKTITFTNNSQNISAIEVNTTLKQKDPLNTEETTTNPKRESIHLDRIKSMHTNTETVVSADLERETLNHDQSTTLKSKDTYEKSLSNLEPENPVHNLNRTYQNMLSNLTQSYKPETLVYTVTSIDTSENNLCMPLSKGDDFHASSLKIEMENQSGLENPLTTSHCYKAPKVKTRKPAESVESKYEAAINSISYDANVSASESNENGQDVKISSSESQSQESSNSKSAQCKKTILNELLDMSDSSLPDGFEDKDVMAKPDVETVKEALKRSIKNVSSMGIDDEECFEPDKEDKLLRESSEEGLIKGKSSDNSMFLIMRDSIDQLQSNEMRKNFEIQEPGLKTEYLDKSLNVLLQAKSISHDVQESKAESIQSESFSQETSPGEEKATEDENNCTKKADITFKPFKNANDTRELLEILSNLTDKTINEISPRKNTSANKCEQTKHLTFANDFNSLTSKLTISEALSKYSELDEYVPETPAQPVKKSVRLSHDVVKTLNFEDEIPKSSLLKKTAFGETSYMTDKSKVIPPLNVTYDGIKEVMDELVKPMADVMIPLTNKVDKAIYKDTSTCSMQIEANLVTSSQIDLEVCSFPSDNDGIKMLASEVAHQGQESISRALHATSSSESEESYKENRKKGTELEKVIIFDQNNPLNNVLLAPTEFNNAHSYKQKSKEYYKQHNEQQYDIERVSVKVDSERFSPLGNIQEEINPSKSETNISVTELVDSVANTDITMKCNKEMLEDTSSLTLVDSSDLDMEVDEQKTPETPVKLIYQVEEIILDNDSSRKRNYSPLKSNKHSSDAEVTPKPLNKVLRFSHSPISVNISTNTVMKSPNMESPGKRSPSKKLQENKFSAERETKEQNLELCENAITVIALKRIAAEDVKEVASSNNLNLTNKSPTKTPIKNISSPSRTLEKRSSTPPSEKLESPIKKIEIKASPKNTEELYKKACPVVTVQRMAVEYEKESVGNDVSTETSSTCFKDAANNVSSKKNKSQAASAHSFSTSSVGTVSKSTSVDLEPSTNVVSKIEMLSCISTKQCEWEAAGVDTMSFRLLHSRVRVVFRLDHRHDNAARTHVRADTPVQTSTARAMLSDIYPKDQRNVIAALGVKYATEVMKFHLQNVRKAGDIPCALKRCVGIAENALRWAKCMYEAYIQLAFTLTLDGNLTLKVCNVPLRSVWEVRLQIGLCSAHGPPHPRARHVTAAGVVGAPPADPAAVSAAPGWGHAPQTIWKVFRYLKSQKADVTLSLV